MNAPTQEPAPTASDSGTRSGFARYNLAPDVLEALTKLGITAPTPIQEKVIGPIVAGKDVIGKAETGTGKTIGFGGPLVSKIDTSRVAVQALVLTPTRELAQQVSGVLQQLGAGRDLKVALVVGGVHASEQVIQLRRGSQIVVGTPGRVLEFLKDRTLSVVWCETMVIDEADRMFDMGFIDDIRAIFDFIPKERQTLFFSATIPGDVRKLMEEQMQNPEMFETASGHATVEEIRQVCRRVEFPRKFDELKKILDQHKDQTCLVFTNTRRQAIDLDRMLWGHNYPARALHGDHDQDTRFKVLESFRGNELRILVATDVASRGLDVENIGVVINFEVPNDVDSYVHRIGRTGRASRSGVAYTMVARKEMPSWHKILEATGFQVEDERGTAGGGRRRDERGSEGGGRRGGSRKSGRGRGGRRRRDRSDSSGDTSSQGGGDRSRGSKRGRRPERAASDKKGDQKGQPKGEARGGDQGKRRGGPSAGPPDAKRGGSRNESGRSQRRSKPAEPDVSVDLFDVSMRDFLDVSRPIEEFSRDEPGGGGGKRRDADAFGAGIDSATPSDTGGGRADEAGKSGGDSESRGRRSRRRGKRGGKSDAPESPSSSNGRGESESQKASGPDQGGEGKKKKKKRSRRRGRGRSRRNQKSSSSGSGSSPGPKSESGS